MNKVLVGIMAATLSLTTLLTGCGSTGSAGGGTAATAGKTEPSAKEQNYVTIATGGSSGVYYTLGGALAKLYKDKLGYNASAQSTGSSVENINLVSSKKVDMAFVMSDVTVEADTGKGNFEKNGPVKNIKAMGGLYMNYVHVITLNNPDIKSIADLKGKRIGVGAPNSGTEVNARMVLAGYGMSYKDVKPDYLSFAECVEQLKNGTIDAAFMTSGLGTSAVIDLQTAGTVGLVPIEPAKIEEMKKANKAVIQSDIPAGTYKNDKPVTTVAMKNILIVRDDFSEEQVYKMTKAFFESLNELATAHKTAKEIDAKQAGKDLVIPLHPGAEKYFKEVGGL
ncbi:TAXI family TRAP transporter solute-binding subunit [Aneurinibacillus tyrosinisolvens]|uniref:TAXI family TRAP transporter solute-binding subunit n=1 Tax=Aneurinibacillus tyrosinisolvens TaxID=1443435 RepID=UPI00063F8844|nr:TAXI family TRAP transporter solute-binding subunit [Aneurinibacillus tyrosinisolvens]